MCKFLLFLKNIIKNNEGKTGLFPQIGKGKGLPGRHLQEESSQIDLPASV